MDSCILLLIQCMIVIIVIHFGDYIAVVLGGGTPSGWLLYPSDMPQALLDIPHYQAHLVSFLPPAFFHGALVPFSGRWYSWRNQDFGARRVHRQEDLAAARPFGPAGACVHLCSVGVWVCPCESLFISSYCIFSSNPASQGLASFPWFILVSPFFYSRAGASNNISRFTISLFPQCTENHFRSAIPVTTTSSRLTKLEFGIFFFFQLFFCL